MNHRRAILWICAFGATLAGVAASAAEPQGAGLELGFEENWGQSDVEVDFLLRGRGYSVFLTAREALLGMTGSDGSVRSIGLRWLGASLPASVEGVDSLRPRVNYFRGKDPDGWRRGIPTYSKVCYREIYPGIDLVFHRRRQGFEYDFVVAPGADPTQIRIEVLGADSVHEGDGGLLLTSGAARVRQRPPVLFQEIDGVRRTVAGELVVVSRNPTVLAFDIENYERTSALVIDPVVTYSTYIGGTGADSVAALTVGDSGTVYLTGATGSANFRSTQGSLDPDCGTDGACNPGAVGNLLGDAFVLQLDAAGEDVVEATFFGGSGNDEGTALTIGPQGNIYLVGTTSSLDLPGPNADQPELGGGDCVSFDGDPVDDAFLAKFTPDLSGLIFSTYLGGCEEEEAAAVAVDADGRAIVVGTVREGGFPTTEFAPDPFYNGGSSDAFVARFHGTNFRRLMGTYLGTSSTDRGNAVGVDSEGNIFVGGMSASQFGFPTTENAVQPEPGGFVDGWLVKLDLRRIGPTAIVYATNIGGEGGDGVNALALGEDGHVYLTGDTGSMDLPVTDTAFQRTCECTSSNRDNSDAWVGRLDINSSRWVYLSYLGGNQPDEGFAIAVDGLGRAYVTGRVKSTDFPTRFPFQSELADVDEGDAFVAKVSATGRSLAFSSFLGGGRGGFFIAGPRDTGRAIGVDPSGNVYVAGSTFATDFPTSAGVLRPGADDGAFGTFEGWAVKLDTAVVSELLSALVSEIDSELFLAPSQKRLLDNSVRLAALALESGDLEAYADALRSLAAQIESLVGGRVITPQSAEGMLAQIEELLRLGQETASRPFVRGDCDGDGDGCTGVNDALALLSWLFQGAEAPSCVAACDQDGNGDAELTDAVFGLDFCFQGTTPPAAPFPGCGLGPLPSDQALGCEVASPPCR